MTLRFAPQSYPGGRILLMLGQHEIGAVFPSETGESRWSFFLSRTPPHGSAKSVQAAKNAILAEARDWLRKAGVQDG